MSRQFTRCSWIALALCAACLVCGPGAADDIAAYRWVKVTDRAAYAPRDGAGPLVFRNRMWLIGGWNPGDKQHFPRICNNEVWCSADGVEWTQSPTRSSTAISTRQPTGKGGTPPATLSFRTRCGSSAATSIRGTIILTCGTQPTVRSGTSSIATSPCRGDRGPCTTQPSSKTRSGCWG